MTSALGGSLVNPLLFLGGALLVAVPILIHLLNRRRFRIVDWAAMEFLLEADKKNRRRVQLENLLLLLLRCLAVLLLALLLARPFDSSGLSARLLGAQRFERILLVDDSLSMKARIGNRSAMEIAVERATDLIRGFAGEQAENAVTLMVSSRPGERLLNAAPLSAARVDDVLAEVSSLSATDQPGQFVATLQDLSVWLENQPANVNRVVYILSDLRRRDWAEEGNSEGDESPAVALLRNISKHTQGCFVVDVASDEDRNLLVADILPEKTVVEGVESRFEVRVQNAGQLEANNVKVKFTVGDAVPVVQTVASLPAGETIPLQFSFLFQGDDTFDTASSSASADSAEADRALRSRTVRVELLPERGGEEDRLAEDSVAFLAPQVIPGIPVLLVDGDPSATFGKAESFYLKRALRPTGQTVSGVLPEVVTETELETLDLNRYRVIFLCNVYRLAEKPLADLRAWVAAGGGLVILPGDQVDEEYFNLTFGGDQQEPGSQFTPVLLESMQGDETERAWFNFRIAEEQHPVLVEFAGQQNPLLAGVKVFRWWKLVPQPRAEGPPPQILARFSDPEESPALVEQPYGAGRLVVSALPADADWSTWTSDPSYILAMQMLVRYLTPGDARDGNLRVGQPLRQGIDITQYELDAPLQLPSRREVNLQAAQLPGADAHRWLLTFPDTWQQGLYQLKLGKRDGGEELRLFAVNVDPAEGNLLRASVSAMQRQLRDTGVKFVEQASGGLNTSGAQLEIWKYLLGVLVIVLLGESLLSWVFGWRR
jgi:hypothetical protein